MYGFPNCGSAMHQWVVPQFWMVLRNWQSRLGWMHQGLGLRLSRPTGAAADLHRERGELPFPAVVKQQSQHLCWIQCKPASLCNPAQTLGLHCLLFHHLLHITRQFLKWSLQSDTKGGAFKQLWSPQRKCKMDYPSLTCWLQIWNVPVFHPEAILKRDKEVAGTVSRNATKGLLLLPLKSVGVPDR